jgi:hypothetical protein
MKLSFPGLAAVAALSMGLVATSDAFAQKNNKTQNASAEDYDVLNAVKDVRGKVANISTTSNTLTITVETNTSAPAQGAKTNVNPNPAVKQNIRGQQAEAREIARVQQDMARLQQEIAKMQQAELQLAQSKNVKDAASKRAKLQQEMKRVQQDYARLQKDLVRLQALDTRNAVVDQRNFQQALAKQAKLKNRTVKEQLNFDLVIEDKAVIRKMFAPANLTDKEKQELKGKNTSLPGYTATIDEIAVGQEVHIYLTADKQNKEGARPTINKVIILTEK